MTTHRVHHCLRCSGTEYDLVIDEHFYAAVCRQCLLVAMTFPLPVPDVSQAED